MLGTVLAECDVSEPPLLVGDNVVLSSSSDIAESCSAVARTAWCTSPASLVVLSRTVGARYSFRCLKHVLRAIGRGISDCNVQLTEYTLHPMDGRPWVACDWLRCSPDELVNLPHQGCEGLLCAVRRPGSVEPCLTIAYLTREMESLLGSLCPRTHTIITTTGSDPMNAASQAEVRRGLVYAELLMVDGMKLVAEYVDDIERLEEQHRANSQRLVASMDVLRTGEKEKNRAAREAESASMKLQLAFQATDEKLHDILVNANRVDEEQRRRLATRLQEVRDDRQHLLAHLASCEKNNSGDEWLQDELEKRRLASASRLIDIQQQLQTLKSQLSEARKTYAEKQKVAIHRRTRLNTLLAPVCLMEEEERRLASELANAPPHRDDGLATEVIASTVACTRRGR